MCFSGQSVVSLAAVPCALGKNVSPAVVGSRIRQMPGRARVSSETQLRPLLLSGMLPLHPARRLDADPCLLSAVALGTGRGFVGSHGRTSVACTLVAALRHLRKRWSVLLVAAHWRPVRLLPGLGSGRAGQRGVCALVGKGELELLPLPTASPPWPGLPWPECGFPL